MFENFLKIGNWKLKMGFLLFPLLLSAFFLPYTLYLIPYTAHAAVLTIEPPTGTFIVGSTFSVPVYVNTEGEAINAIEIEGKFPEDKLQIISPSAGQSVITLWAEQPTYNNRNGTFSLQGLISDGLVAQKGLVTTLAFRVKAPGDAYIKFLGETKVLKHDGLGTDALKETNGALYRLILPPPAGPAVASETHPDSYTTYTQSDVFFSWTPNDPSVQNYSYMLSRDPVDTPDDIPEGAKTSINYRQLSDGKHYFHIKAYRNQSWGGTTHFGVSVDATPPAEFPVQILPDNEVKEGAQAVAQFATTDTISGLDHYEIRVISLEPAYYDPEKAKQAFFVEATSPYILTDLTHPGKYDVVVRAYDNAGNYRDSVTHVRVVPPLISMVGERGIELGSRILIPWWLTMLLLTLLILLLLVVGLEVRKENLKAEERLQRRALHPDIALKKDELEKKRAQYTKLGQLVVLAFVCLSGIFAATGARAEVVGLEPPVITTFSQNISNEEIFYAGGVSVVPGVNILLYVQNLTTGETILEQVESNERGEWFYRHNGFLSPGDYVLWTQSALGGEKSPPSPQTLLTVDRTAIEFGATRLSYAFFSGVIALLLLLIVIGEIIYILYHQREAKRKHERWLHEVREAQEAVRRGFAVLKRDIESELETIRKIKLDGALQAEEVGREAQLLKDLAWAEENIQREVSDIEKEF